MATTTSPKYAQILDPSPVQSATAIRELELSTHNGELALKIPSPVVDSLAEPLKFALIGKFSRGRPNMNEIRRFFADMKFSADYTVGLLDTRHILINFKVKSDYIRLFSNFQWSVCYKPMRILKWMPNFQVDIEPPIVPAWFVLPMLPAHLYDLNILALIANGIGKFLRADAATMNLTRPSLARVQVEINLLHELPSRIWIQQGSEEGFWQEFYMEDDLPSYCTFCCHIGHKEDTCLLKHPPTRDSVVDDNGQRINGKPKSGRYGNEHKKASKEWRAIGHTLKASSNGTADTLVSDNKAHDSTSTPVSDCIVTQQQVLQLGGMSHVDADVSTIKVNAQPIVTELYAPNTNQNDKNMAHEDSEQAVDHVPKPKAKADGQGNLQLQQASFGGGRKAGSTNEVTTKHEKQARRGTANVVAGASSKTPFVAAIVTTNSFDPISSEQAGTKGSWADETEQEEQEIPALNTKAVNNGKPEIKECVPPDVGIRSQARKATSGINSTVPLENKPKENIKAVNVKDNKPSTDLKTNEQHHGNPAKDEGKLLRTHDIIQDTANQDKKQPKMVSKPVRKKTQIETNLMSDEEYEDFIFKYTPEKRTTRNRKPKMIIDV